MNSHSIRIAQLAAAGAIFATSASAQVVISDNFEVDTSADYTIVDDGTPDGTQTFAFDYVAAGIPLAPHSAPGDSGGLRLTSNDSIGAGDAWTLFHNTNVAAPRYKLTVDVLMNFMGTSGSTEFLHVGVGGDGATFNSVFSPISGSGVFMSSTGDGGSSSDHRWFRDAANTPMGGSGSTTLPNSHPSYLGHASNGTGAFFQDLFPSPPSTIAGSPGNIWTTMEIAVDNVIGRITMSYDGVIVFQGNIGGSVDGLVSLGTNDAFSSISASNNFTLYDNLVVVIEDPLVGTTFCAAEANSTDTGGHIFGTGSGAVSSNDLSLNGEFLPSNSMGYFVTSVDQVVVVNPGGSFGNLCVASLSGMGRFSGPGQVLSTGSGSTVSLQIDLTNFPQPTGFISVMAGETWNFQYWFRDSLGGVVGSNFTDALEVTFN